MRTGRVLALAALLVLIGTGVYAADCNNGGRYEDMGDGTVQDCRTGLVWLKNANCNGQLTWNAAMIWVAGLNDTGNPATRICGLSDGSSAGDWRLPTKTEWMAMVASAKKQQINNPTLTDAAGSAQCSAGCIFTNVMVDSYWSSTIDADSADETWVVDMNYGNVYHFNNKTNDYYVWPVRGGQSGSFGNLIIQ